MTVEHDVIDHSPLMESIMITSKNDSKCADDIKDYGGCDDDKMDRLDGAQNFEELLELTSAWRPYPLFITCSMSFLWSLCALSAISPAFTAPAEGCVENCSFYTIQNEFNLTSYIIEPAELTTSVYFLGNFLIGQLFACLADRFGRRPIILVSLFVTGTAGILGSFAPSFPCLLFARFVQGSCYTPLTAVNYVLSGESIPNRSQSLASIFFGVCWVLGYCFLAPMSIWFPTWRSLQLATSVPNVFLGIFLILTLPESIAYSIQQNDKKAVKRWIRNNEIFSCRKIPHNLNAIVSKSDKEEVTAISMWKMLRNFQNESTILRRMFIETILWILTFMTYCALSLTSTSVGNSNPIISFLFSGIVELPAYVFIPVVLKWSKRIPTRIFCHLFASSSLFIMFFLDLSSPIHLPIWLIAKFCAACCYIFCFIYASELFPTHCRSCCIGVCSTFCNLGAIVSPHIFLLDFVLPSSQFLLLSAVGLVCAFLSFLQPETKV